MSSSSAVPKRTLTPIPEPINATNLKHNIGVLQYFRVSLAIICGTVIGILGVSGYQGFVPHFATQMLCVLAMLVKAKGMSPSETFHSTANLFLVGTFSSSTLLSFMLFWMVFFNLGHVFG